MIVGALQWLKEKEEEEEAGGWMLELTLTVAGGNGLRYGSVVFVAWR